MLKVWNRMVWKQTSRLGLLHVCIFVGEESGCDTPPIFHFPPLNSHVIIRDHAANTFLILELKQYAERGSTSQFERLKKMIENPSSMNFGHHYSGMGQSSSPAATPPSTPHSGVSANGYNMPSMLGFRAHGHQSKFDAVTHMSPTDLTRPRIQA